MKKKERKEKRKRVEKRKEEMKEGRKKKSFNKNISKSYSRCDLNCSSSFFSHALTAKLVTRKLISVLGVHALILNMHFFIQTLLYLR